MVNTVIRTCRYFTAMVLVLADRYEWVDKGVKFVLHYRKSRFAQQAFILLVCNVISRAVSFLGNAYAAKCLGVVNFGISGVIQNVARPAALFADLGFDNIATRKIASGEEDPLAITTLVVGVRALFGLVVGSVWLIVCFNQFEGRALLIWSISALLILIDANFGVLQLRFSYQGLEKLHIQTIIATFSGLVTAGYYFVFFHSNMPMGSDLLVLVSVNALMFFISWGYFFKNIGSLRIFSISFRKALNLIKESKLYFLNHIVVFFCGNYQIPFIAFLIGSANAGIFRAAWGMSMVVDLLFYSISGLLIPRLAKWKSQGDRVFKTKQRLLVRLYLLIGIPLILFLILVSDFVFSILFGSEFAESSNIFRILIISRLIVFVGQVYAFSLIALKLDKAYVFTSIVGAVVSITMNIIFLPVFGIYAAAFSTLACDISLGILFYFFYNKLGKISENE